MPYTPFGVLNKNPIVDQNPGLLNALAVILRAKYKDAKTALDR
jgi:hypothetical protein